MKKVKIISLIILLFFIGKGIGYIQCDHYVLEPYSVTENTVTFEIRDNLYDWEISGNEKFEMGKEYAVTMFDCETFDPTDDYFVSIKPID